MRQRNGKGAGAGAARLRGRSGEGLRGCGGAFLHVGIGDWLEGIGVSRLGKKGRIRTMLLFRIEFWSIPSRDEIVR